MVLIHNDIDVPFSKEGSAPAYLDQMTAVLKRTPTRLSSGHILAWAAWFDQSRITPQISRRYLAARTFITYTLIFPGTRLPSTSSPTRRRSRSRPI